MDLCGRDGSPLSRPLVAGDRQDAARLPRRTPSALARKGAARFHRHRDRAFTHRRLGNVGRKSRIRGVARGATRGAKRCIYMENQYPPLIAAELARRLAEPAAPEVILLSAEHSPSYSDQ